jgi:LacI family transcriptional regulator
VPHRPRATVTLRDVAAAAGVSVATASRVLNGGRTVDPVRARRVLAAADELRYSADMSARAMRGASDTVALMVDDISSASIAVVVAAMEREARTVGGFVTVSATGGDPARQAETARTLCAFRPRAVILTSSRVEATSGNERLLAELRAYECGGGRVVTYGGMDLPFDAIGVDERASARLLGEHLARTGHRRPVILAGTRDRSFTAARTSGFVEGLLAGGVDVQDIRIVPCEVSRAGGHAAAKESLHSGLDALVAVNDTVAVGALAACREAGVRVPGDISVTGFDDVPLAIDVTPQLTTVAIPFAEIGAAAVRMALSGSPAQRTVTGSLRVRASSHRNT